MFHHWLFSFVCLSSCIAVQSLLLFTLLVFSYPVDQMSVTNFAIYKLSICIRKLSPTTLSKSIILAVPDMDKRTGTDFHGLTFSVLLWGQEQKPRPPRLCITISLLLICHPAIFDLPFAKVIFVNVASAARFVASRILAQFKARARVLFFGVSSR